MASTPMILNFFSEFLSWFYNAIKPKTILDVLIYTCGLNHDTMLSSTQKITKWQTFPLSLHNKHKIC